MNVSTPMTGKIRTKTNATIACHVCGREFNRNRKADLQRHMRIHTNEKPYACEVEGCGKAFRQSSALRNHHNVHTREKPYQCELCEQRFFDKPTCNRHKREMHGPYVVFKCTFPTCSKQFKRKGQFKRHMQEKHQMTYTEEDVARHRVSAQPPTSSSSSQRSGSTVPRLSDTLQGIRGSPLSVRGHSYIVANSTPSYTLSSTSTSVMLRNPYSAGQADGSSYVQGHQSPHAFPRYADSNQGMNVWRTGSGSRNSPFLGVGGPNITHEYSPPSSHSPSPDTTYLSISSSSSGSTGSYSPNSSFSRPESPGGLTPSPPLGGQYLLKPATDYSSYIANGSPYQ